MRPEGPRDPVAGPDGGPEPPFPLKLSGKVIKGFGRGSKELGIPTANIPLSGLTVGGHDNLESGIYFGWAGLEFPDPPSTSDSDASTPARRRSISEKVKQAGAKLVDGIGSLVYGSEDESASEEEDGGSRRGRVYPMVMSVGWNPFYKNRVRSVEVHIMHQFPHDFYGRHLNLLMLGFIRPEYDYVSKESLIEDIQMDIQVAGKSLARPAYRNFKKDQYLRTVPDMESSKGDVAS